jgi:hypothetical protein
MPHVDLTKVWPAPARAEVARISSDAKRQGWSTARLKDLMDFLEPGEVVALIGESIGIARRPGGDVHRWFSRRPMENDNRE